MGVEDVSILVPGKEWLQSEICASLLYLANLLSTFTKCPVLAEFWGFSRKIRKTRPSCSLYSRRGRWTINLWASKQTRSIYRIMIVIQKISQGEFTKGDWMGEGNCRWSVQKGFREVVLYESRPEWQEVGNYVKIREFQAKGLARTKALRQEWVYSQEQKGDQCTGITVNRAESRKRWGQRSSNPIAYIEAKKIEFGELRNGDQPDLGPK